MYFSSSSFSIFLFYKTKIVEQKYINLDSTTFLLHLYIVCILHCVPCFPDTSTCIGTGAYIFHGCWDVGMMPACWHACMHACNELLHKLLRGKPPQQGYNTSDLRTAALKDLSAYQPSSISRCQCRQRDRGSDLCSAGTGRGKRAERRACRLRARRMHN